MAIAWLARATTICLALNPALGASNLQTEAVFSADASHMMRRDPVAAVIQEHNPSLVQAHNGPAESEIAETYGDNNPDATVYHSEHGHQIAEGVTKAEDTTVHHDAPNNAHELRTEHLNNGENLKNCGGHTATRCRLCTVICPAGLDWCNEGAEIPDQGPSWCHRDCKYYDGECHTLTAHNVHVERTAYEDHQQHGIVESTTLIPDLLNPEITAEDETLMHEAAKRGIQEADYEAKLRLANEAKEEEEKKDKMKKMMYGGIMGMTACFVLCACASWCGLCRMLGFGKKKKGAKKLQDPGEDYDYVEDENNY